MKIVTISAAKARNNLGKILAEAYFSRVTFLVTKNNKVLAEIKKPVDIKERMESFFENFGSLSNSDSSFIKKIIAKSKKSPARNTSIKPF